MFYLSSHLPLVEGPKGALLSEIFVKLLKQNGSAGL